jgi:hypothetical protein
MADGIARCGCDADVDSCQSYDYNLEKVKSFTRVPIGDIIGISKGKKFDKETDPRLIICARRIYHITSGGSQS